MTTNPFHDIKNSVKLTDAERAQMRARVILTMQQTPHIVEDRARHQFSPNQNELTPTARKMVPDPVSSVTMAQLRGKPSFWKTLDFKLGMGALAAVAGAVLIVFTQNMHNSIKVGGTIGGASGSRTVSEYIAYDSTDTAMDVAPANPTVVTPKLSAVPARGNTYVAPSPKTEPMTVVSTAMYTPQASTTATQITSPATDQTRPQVTIVSGNQTSDTSEHSGELMTISEMKDLSAALLQWNTKMICSNEKKKSLCNDVARQLIRANEYLNAAKIDYDNNADAGQVILEKIQDNREFISAQELVELYRNL